MFVHAESCLAEYLSQHNRHLEAAQIVLDYQKNVEQAVHILCRGTQFGEAFRLVSSSTSSDIAQVNASL
jgi:elongator complex protein 1